MAKSKESKKPVTKQSARSAAASAREAKKRSAKVEDPRPPAQSVDARFTACDPSTLVPAAILAPCKSCGATPEDADVSICAVCGIPLRPSATPIVEAEPSTKATSLLHGIRFSEKTSRELVALYENRVSSASAHAIAKQRVAIIREQIAKIAKTEEEIIAKEKSEGRVGTAGRAFSAWASKSLTELTNQKDKLLEDLGVGRKEVATLRLTVRGTVEESERLIKGENPIGTLYEETALKAAKEGK